MYEDRKLDEAKYFLARMQLAQASREERTFTFEASAFLSAARSVLLYACDEAKGNGKQAWYDAWVSRDESLRFLRDERDENIHRRPVAPVTIESVAPGPLVGNDQYQTVETEFAFLEWRGPENAVALSQRILDALERMVQDGQQVGCLSRYDATYEPGRRSRRTSGCS